MKGSYIRAWCTSLGIKYFVMMIWLLVCLVLFWKTYDCFRYRLDFFYIHQLLGSWLCISRGAATVLNFNCGLVLLPVSPTLRSLLRKCNKQISIEAMRVMLDSCKGFHITCAIFILIASVTHATGHLFNARNFSKHYTKIHQDVNGAQFMDEDPLWIIFRTIPGITGIVLLVVLILIVTSSTHYMREVNYDLFFITHKLVIVFYILLLVHGMRGPIKRQLNIDTHTPGCLLTETSTLASLPEAEYHISVYTCDEEPKFESIGCESWMWIGVPLLIYSCDKLFHLVRRTSVTTVTEIVLYPDEIIKIFMHQKGFSAEPGQYILLNCPEISVLEWHPYSFTMCPSNENEDFAVTIQVLGDWSGDLVTIPLRKLKRKIIAEKQLEQEPELLVASIPRSLSVIIDGPFSSSLEGIINKKIVVCIGGGIGITPFLSVLHFLRNLKNYFIPLQRIYLVCVSRSLPSIMFFIEDIYNTHNMLWNKNRPDLLEVQFHFTQMMTLEWGICKSIPERTLEFVNKRSKLERPQWTSVFEDLSLRHQRQKINVYTCGTRGLNSEVRNTCLMASTQTTQFIFHKENF